jgi:hypothetical protein
MLDPEAGGYAALMAVQGFDDRLHAVVVSAVAEAPIGQALAVNGAVAVGIFYDVDPTRDTARGGFYASAGTVILSRRCAGGLGATLGDVTLVEVDLTTEQSIVGGCTTSIESYVFEAGDACP